MSHAKKIDFTVFNCFFFQLYIFTSADKLIVTTFFYSGKFNLDPGNVVEGRLQKLKKRSGILVNLVGGAKGVVCLTDLYDEYQNDPLSKFHQGQHLKCYVIDLGPKQTYQLSLRRSR